MKQAWITAVILWALASIANAAVTINEIAWMGTAISGSDEWIELYNPDSDAIELTGWTIESADGSPAIALSGTIGGGAYFLIERTDDTTVPAITADLIAPFGNGLENVEGETLYVKDAANATVDTVIGGADWSNIGGNNTTKETAQRTATGWITATGTPRSTNATAALIHETNLDGEVLGDSTENNNDEQDGNSVGASGSSKPSIFPRAEITVIAGDDKSAFTGFPLEFSGRAFGLYDDDIPNATYRWNFGDGSTETGKSVVHEYRFAGEYVSTLEVFWANHRNRDRVTVTVVDPEIVFERIIGGADGLIELKNRSMRDIDISGWKLLTKSGNGFVFPVNTFVLKGKSIIFPTVVTGLIESASGALLFYPNGALAANWEPKEKTLPAGSVKGASTVKATIPRTNKSAASENMSATSSDDEINHTKNATQTAAAILWERDLKSPASSNYMWFIILGSFVLIAVAGFLLMKSKMDEATEADEYAIIEDIFDDGSEDNK